MAINDGRRANPTRHTDKATGGSGRWWGGRVIGLNLPTPSDRKARALSASHVGCRLTVRQTPSTAPSSGTSAAHEQPLWRLAALGAAFGRTGI